MLSVIENDILDYKEYWGKVPQSYLTKNDYFSRLSFCFLPFFQTNKEDIKADTLTHTKKGQQSSEGVISCPLYISHPVSQKKKKVYRTDQTTFILGETPKGVRRYAI